MSTASRGRIARWARDLVKEHVWRTVRGLPRSVARDRADQVASDIWEQSADADRRGHTAVRLAAALLLRALVGIPADAAWRRAELNRSARLEPATRPVQPLAAGRMFDQTNGAVDFGDEGMQDPNDPLTAIERRSGPAGVVAGGFMGIGM